MNSSKEKQGFHKYGISEFKTTVFVADILLNKIKGEIEK